MNLRYFTSESVTEGHPDKICDQISDKILDELLKQDPYSRCACEVTVEPGAVHIMGEISSNAVVDYEDCARQVIRSIGYTKKEYGFWDGCEISCSIQRQSLDIARGVDRALESRESEAEAELGAGDQGMMFGYACKETEGYLPLAISYANQLTKRLAYVRKMGILPYLRPDGKAQVTVAYDGNTPVWIPAIVVSAQHDPDIDTEELQRDIREHVIAAIIPSRFLRKETKIFINPTGRFVIGGPAGDTGLTGRKIIADTYGGYARHGGGAFSGKDPTKVDRSAAYAARCIAKHIVAAGLAERCELQLSYVIGVAQPVSISVDSFGTGKISDRCIEQWIMENLDLRPSSLIEALDLRKPIYLPTAAYGHFSSNSYPWEKLNHNLLESMKQIEE